jgi:2-polyprenyl-3-methyl-5-hydroxy-6-metoxy-1,4-benzoquinol methylase
MTMTTTDEPHVQRPYPLSNDHLASPAHHEALGELLDPFSTDRVIGLFDERLITGRRCLEVGAGGGAFAFWLAGQVGPDGFVLATDADLRHVQRLPALPQLGLMQHDLTLGAAPLGTGWDFIHARLILSHLPNRGRLLHELSQALKRGGILLVEDWDTTRGTDMVLDAPDNDTVALFAKFQHITGTRVFAGAGTDRSWARHTNAMMRAEGLDPVDTVVHATSWPGGGA